LFHLKKSLANTFDYLRPSHRLDRIAVRELRNTYRILHLLWRSPNTAPFGAKTARISQNGHFSGPATLRDYV
jgi:hypothetical protein